MEEKAAAEGMDHLMDSVLRTSNRSSEQRNTTESNQPTTGSILSFKLQAYLKNSFLNFFQLAGSTDYSMPIAYGESVLEFVKVRALG